MWGLIARVSPLHGVGFAEGVGMKLHVESIWRTIWGDGAMRLHHSAFTLQAPLAARLGVCRPRALVNVLEVPVSPLDRSNERYAKLWPPHTALDHKRQG